MNPIRPVSIGLLICFAVVFSTGTIVRAEDFIIGSGDSRTIDNLVSLTTEHYGNNGTLTILSGGVLSLGADVLNSPAPPAGVIGLNLGKVVNEGLIDAQQTIRFREESQLGGTIQSSDRVIFDGPVTVRGKISAEMIVFNYGSDTTAYSSIDLTDSDSGLETDCLVINSRVDVTLLNGETFEIESLELGQSGAILEVSEDIVVHGNFLAASGSGLASKLNAAGTGQGSILLKGGGAVIEGSEDYGGINNFLAGTIKGETVTVQNRSYIIDLLNVGGNFVLDTDSHTESAAALNVDGKLFLKEGATLALNGTDTSTMIPFGYYGYNGIFGEGFDLAAGSSLVSTTDGGALFLAVMGDSTIQAAATFAAENVLLSGVDGYGDATLRRLENAGIMESETLYLLSMELKNIDDGTIDVNNLILIDNSVLDLSDNSDENGGLTFFGDDRGIYISANSQLRAGNGKILDFDGVIVENRNKDGGIYASEVRFGKGAILVGDGSIYADTVFAKDSKLILGLSHTDFGSRDVSFESGSTIALSIDPQGYGTLLSTGIIKTDDGVFLEIIDGSNFDGRIQYFCVAQGGDGSEFSSDLQLNSQFFQLSNVIPIGAGEFDPSLDNTLWVEIVKVADLVDYAGSRNQQQFAAMIDRLITIDGASDAQKHVFDGLMRITSDTEYRRALSSLSGGIRANSLVVAMSSPWRASLERAGMERLSLHVPRRGRTASQTESTTDFFGQSASPFQCNLWFDSYYNHTNLRSDGNASGGLGDRFGMNLGAEWTPTHETLFGWTFGYANGSFTQDDGHLRINDYQFGLYGGANLFKRNFQVRGYIGYGHLDFAQDRRVSLPNAWYTAHGTTPGDSLSASLMLIRPVDLSDQFLFKPTFGLDFERITQKGFSEYGDPGIRLSYSGASFQRLMLRFGASGEHSFRRSAIWGRFFYGIKAVGDSAATSYTQLVGVADHSIAIRSVNIGNSVFDVGLGGRHSLNAAKTLSVFADYNGSFAKRSDSHTGSLGFLWKR